MGYGDEILAAGQAQRWFDAYGASSVIVGQDDQPRWSEIWAGNPAILAPHEVLPADHRIVNGPHCRPYIIYPFTAATGWTFNRGFHARDHVAKIYLTADELHIGREVRQVYGPFVLIDPWSKHENLRWSLGRWQALIDSRPDLTFVQQVYDCVDPPRRQLEHVRPVLTPSFRAACGLLASAALYVRGESGMCHAAAALGIPQVTIWGACMDWDVLGGYPKQLGVGVSTAPCGAFAPCAHCALAMAAISIARVSRAMDDQLACYPPSA